MSRPLSRRPVHWAATQHVYVKMKYRLPGAGTVINYGPITALGETFSICDPRGNAKQVAQQRLVFLRRVVERFKVFLRNHEQVSGCLRIEVANNYRPIVLVHKVGWNFIRHYSAKQATLF